MHVPPQFEGILAWLRSVLIIHAPLHPRCPLCGQHYAQRKRLLNAGMVKGLIAMANAPLVDGWAELSFFESPNREHPRLIHWGLVEKAPNDDPSKTSSGKWRVTAKGFAFLNGAITVPRAVYLLPHNTFVGFSEEHITVHEALKVPFDIRDT